jgi:peptide/nickel transport system permease protein
MRIPWLFLLRRLVLTIPVLGAMSVVVFLVLHLVPGDPARTMLGLRATPELVEEVRASMRLDESLPSQYLHWIEGVVQGDLGRDHLAGQPVGEIIGGALPVTFELAFLSMLVALGVGLPAGILAARRPGRVRRATEGFVILGTSIPDFWLGIMLITLFSTALALLPPSGYVPFADDPIGNLRYFVMPALALGLGQAAFIARTTRAAVEDVLRAPFVLFLRAKGVPEPVILWRHALRNAAPQIVTVVGILTGVLLGGAIVIETIFGLPGLGRVLITAIEQRNYTVVQGAVLVIAATFITVNLVTDVLVAWLDPRVADGGAA